MTGAKRDQVPGVRGKPERGGKAFCLQQRRVDPDGEVAQTVDARVYVGEHLIEEVRGPFMVSLGRQLSSEAALHLDGDELLTDDQPGNEGERKTIGARVRAPRRLNTRSTEAADRSAAPVLLLITPQGSIRTT